MKPPKCGLCEHEHWNSEPHVWIAMRVATKPVATKPVATLTEAEQKALKKALVKSTDIVHPGELTETARVHKWREGNRERYNERMRSFWAKRKGFIGVPYG